MKSKAASVLSSRLWGYAEADPTIVGVLVVTIAVLAVAYVIMRLWRGSGSSAGTRPGKGTSSRG